MRHCQSGAADRLRRHINGAPIGKIRNSQDAQPSPASFHNRAKKKVSFRLQTEISPHLPSVLRSEISIVTPRIPIGFPCSSQMTVDCDSTQMSRPVFCRPAKSVDAGFTASEDCGAHRQRLFIYRLRERWSAKNSVSKAILRPCSRAFLRHNS